MSSEFLDAALAYAGMGLCVIPLRPRSKLPMFQNWPEVATSDREQVQRWWTQTPAANVGLVTGRKSGVFVFDVDSKAGGMDTYETLRSTRRFPETWQQMTGGGGLHLMFRYPAFEVRNSAGIWPGIDIRGEGGQVVVPPSVHPSGRQYVWDGLDDIAPDNLAEAPDWLLDRLERGTERKPAAPAVTEKIGPGVRNATLTSIAGGARRMGLNEAEILALLRTVNEQRCTPPLPEAELATIAHSVMRYSPDQRADLWRAAGGVLREHARIERQREEIERKRKADPWENGTTGLEVFRQQHTAPTAVIDGLLYQGYTLLAGRPKGGKSILAYQLGVSVANGVGICGLQERAVQPGRVLHVCLEDGAERAGQRLRKLCYEQEDERLSNIEFRWEIRPFDRGGREQLESTVEQMRPTLVVIDTLRALVNGGPRGNDIVGEEYRWADALHRLAMRYKAAILVTHHTSATGKVAGTYGTIAGADSIWTLRREVGEKSGQLEVMGRDTEDTVFQAEFCRGMFGWNFLGESGEFGQDQADIVEILTQEGPQSLNQLVSKTGRRYTVLMRLIHSLSLPKTSDGKYYVRAA